MPSTTPDLSISIPPLLNREVDYLSDISVPIQIKNSSTGPAMIELITLRFQSDWNVPGPDVAITEHFTDFTLDPDVLGYRNIKVVPHLVYRQYSNFFDVLLTYRLKEKSGFSEQLTHVVNDAAYLIIRPAPQIFDPVFISFKDPEDHDLAKLLFMLTTRAGFVPYIAPDDVRPGTLIWDEKIRKAIHASKATLVIWTAFTLFGEGVRKEIEISRNAGIPVIPFLEKDIPRPEVYDPSVEYTLFDRSDAASIFAKVVRARRKTV